MHAGRANKVHFVQLLELLEQGQFPSETQAARAELLDELVRTVDPADSAQVLRLARVYGSRGGKEAAAMLYRWAALTDGSANGRLGTVDAHDLVKAAKEHLDAPQLVQLVEELLSWSKPDDRMRRYELDYYETMALELWQEVAEPAQAFEHCRSLCEAITDVSRALRRGSAKAAVPLLARAGELGLALRCLEIALCKLPTEGVDVEHVVFLRDYERPGRLSHQDMRSLFPADSQAWQQPLQWFERAGDSLLTWLGEDRVDMSTAVRAASLLACRIHALGGTEAALALLDRLQAFESVRAVDLLWVVDALYAVGLADRAARIERQLLQEGRLIVTRAVEVVQRTADQEGAEAALRIGSAAAEVTHNEALLVLLAELAETSGQHDKAARWLDLNARSEAARAALLKRDKQARR